MNKAVEQALILSARQHITDKSTSLGEREYRSDLERYRSETQLQREKERIFKRLPTIVAHASEVPEPNSYRAVQTVLGSLIVTRDSTGQSHVLRNSCRHRGARLVDGEGCAKRLVCPYHAWSYATDGALNNIPGKRDCFPTIDEASSGLVAVPSVEKYGFIWMCPGLADGEEVEAHLATHLGEMAAHFEWAKPQTLTCYKRHTQTRAGNWKLFSEGGLETYHFAFAHKNTIAPRFYNNIAVIDEVDHHFRVIMPTKDMRPVDEAMPDEPSLHDCSHTLFSVFPNTALLVQEAHIDMIQFRPLAVDNTEITVTTLIPASADLNNHSEALHWQKNHDITNSTLDEDWSLGESIQASINENAIPYLQYGRNEWALRALNDHIDALIQN